MPLRFRSKTQDEGRDKSTADDQRHDDEGIPEVRTQNCADHLYANQVNEVDEPSKSDRSITSRHADDESRPHDEAALTDLESAESHPLATSPLEERKRQNLAQRSHAPRAHVVALQSLRIIVLAEHSE